MEVMAPHLHRAISLELAFLGPPLFTSIELDHVSTDPRESFLSWRGYPSRAAASTSLAWPGQERHYPHSLRRCRRWMCRAAFRLHQIVKQLALSFNSSFSTGWMA
jgi:hypothetical protein